MGDGLLCILDGLHGESRESPEQRRDIIPVTLTSASEYTHWASPMITHDRDPYITGKYTVRSLYY